jgi:hypothetical protein
MLSGGIIIFYQKFKFWTNFSRLPEGIGCFRIFTQEILSLTEALEAVFVQPTKGGEAN